MTFETMSPCMGGWACAKRELCQHYHSTLDVAPSESLCGLSGQVWFIPVEATRSAAVAARVDPCVVDSEGGEHD